MRREEPFYEENTLEGDVPRAISSALPLILRQIVELYHMGDNKLTQVEIGQQLNPPLTRNQVATRLAEAESLLRLHLADYGSRHKRQSSFKRAA